MLQLLEHTPQAILHIFPPSRSPPSRPVCTNRLQPHLLPKLPVVHLPLVAQRNPSKPRLVLVVRSRCLLTLVSYQTIKGDTSTPAQQTNTPQGAAHVRVISYVWILSLTGCTYRNHQKRCALFLTYLAMHRRHCFSDTAGQRPCTAPLAPPKPLSIPYTDVRSVGRAKYIVAVVWSLVTSVIRFM